TQPTGPQFVGRIWASIARPVSQRIQAIRSLLEIRPKPLRRLVSHTGYTTLNNWITGFESEANNSRHHSNRTGRSALRKARATELALAHSRQRNSRAGGATGGDRAIERAG